MTPTLDTLRATVPVDDATGVPDFPTLVACWACGGIRATFRDGVSNPDKDLAYAVALLQHGYYVAKWEGHRVLNSTCFPTRCTCTCAHARATEVTIGRCLHRVTCPDCGAGTVQDSSD